MASAWRWMGDGAVMRAYDGTDDQANALAIAAWRAIGAEHLDEVLDVIPTSRSITVALRGGTQPSARLREMLDATFDPTTQSSTEHTIAVTYDGEDLHEVARLHATTPDEVIAAHTAASYTVAFVGFAPGFGYLSGLPEALHTARLDSPRTRVPAGSVAIGGRWTGVYPSQSPGGWRLIGRTDAQMFDGASLLAPGDRVRFVQT